MANSYAFTTNHYLLGLRYNISCDCLEIVYGDEPDEEGTVWWTCDHCQESGWVAVEDFKPWEEV